jgi:hypothetical protein
LSSINPVIVLVICFVLLLLVFLLTTVSFSPRNAVFLALILVGGAGLMKLVR